MPGTIEDRRLAVSTTVSLSSFLITSSLGVIAAEAVLVTFVLDKRAHLLWFGITAGIGFIASVLSIYFGGMGITDLLKKGFDGDWVWKTQKGYFDKQALCLFAGLAIVGLSVFCGEPKTEKPVLPAEFFALQTDLRNVQHNLDDLKAKYEALSAQVKTNTAGPAKKSARSHRKQ